MGFLGPLVAPGFFANQAVLFALFAGAVVAVVSGVVGTVTVMRGQSFAGHSLADIGSAGGSAAFLVGVSPLYGFVALNLAAAGVMDLLGIRRPRGRDVATGIVLGAALGLAALFLYLDTTTSSTTGVAMSVLFGSIFTVSPSLTPVILVCGVLAAGLLLLLYRPLILSSINADLAAARGIRVRAVGVCFLLALAIAVSLSALTIGAILSTALLIGPAAIALRVTKQTGLAMVIAACVGVVATWLGVVLAYDSYSWPPAHAGWPVSFFVVTLIFVVFAAAQLLPLPGRPRPKH
ncbi:MAG: metal ABC transporter permease [Candidatus Dormibacteraeota bacterium]|nr:metal ABC transporter permease [Candidatus Dormibacteraeota bacterium]